MVEPIRDDDAFIIVSARIVQLNGEIDEFVSRRVIGGLYQLHGIDRDAAITLLISSEGGLLLDAQAIADAIADVQHRGTPIVGRVHGQAMSAAILPLLACSHRETSPDALLMVHGMTTDAGLNDLRNQEAELAVNNRLTSRMAAGLALRTARDIGYWLPLLHDRLPHYFFAEEALAEGLVDEVR